MRQPLGQHFLRDPNVVQAILTAAELEPSETALEIGPGKAVLTEPLAARVARLVAIELDRELAAHLKKRFATQTNVTIVQADFLKINLEELFPPSSPSSSSPAVTGRGSIDSPPVTAGNDGRKIDQKIKALGNIPYAITAPIFEKLLAWPGWDTGVFLIQREVADRMRAREGSKAFGILTLAIQLFAEVEFKMSVPPQSFAPPPEVHSSVIRLRRKTTAGLPPEDIPAFFDFARAAFGHRRKTVVNSLAMATEIPKNKLSKWLQSQQLNPALRAEAISFSDYARIARPWAIYRREMQLTAPTPTSTITQHF